MTGASRFLTGSVTSFATHDGIPAILRASIGDHLGGGKGIDSYGADPGDVRISVEQHGDCVH